MAITNENFCTIYEFISMGGVVGTTGWSAFIWNETDLCNRMLNTYEHLKRTSMDHGQQENTRRRLKMKFLQQFAANTIHKQSIWSIDLTSSYENRV